MLNFYCQPNDLFDRYWVLGSALILELNSHTFLHSRTKFKKQSKVTFFLSFPLRIFAGLNLFLSHPKWVSSSTELMPEQLNFGHMQNSLGTCTVWYTPFMLPFILMCWIIDYLIWLCTVNHLESLLGIIRKGTLHLKPFLFT